MAVSQEEGGGKEACILVRGNNIDKDRVKRDYSMKVKNGKACKFGKRHLYGEVAEGEIFETGRCVPC